MGDLYDSFEKILEDSTDEELDALVSYIVEKGGLTESLSNTHVYKTCHPKHSMYSKHIADEIRSFGGNTLVNVFRGSGPGYDEIVHDVADKVGAKYGKYDFTASVELSILMHVMEKAWDKMSDEQKKELFAELGDRNTSIFDVKTFPVAAVQAAITASGFMAYQVSVMVANAVATHVLGRGLAFAANATITRTIAAFAGPIGWAITAILTAIDIAGPAYRVTIPCVLHVAMLRRKHALSSGS